MLTSFWAILEILEYTLCKVYRKPRNSANTNSIMLYVYVFVHVSYIHTYIHQMKKKKTSIPLFMYANKYTPPTKVIRECTEFWGR